MLKDAAHQHAVIARQNVFGAVAVVHIKVNHRHAFEVMAIQRVLHAHGHVVEKTKAHGLVARGMVTRRAHGTKSIFQLARNHRIGRRQRRACRAQRSLEGVAVDGGIGIELAVLRPASGQFLLQSVGQTLQGGDVHGVMRQLHLGQRGQRCLVARQRVAHTGDE